MDPALARSARRPDLHAMLGGQRVEPAVMDINLKMASLLLEGNTDREYGRGARAILPCGQGAIEVAAPVPQSPALRVDTDARNQDHTHFT